MAHEIMKAKPIKYDLKRVQFNYNNSKCLFTTYNFSGGILSLMCIDSFNHFNKPMKYILLLLYLTDLSGFHIHSQ